MAISGIWLFALSAALYVILIIYAALRLRPTAAARSFRLLMALSLVWTCFTLLEYTVSDPKLMLFAVRGQLTAITLLPVSFIHFVCSYTEKELSYQRLGLLLIVPVITNILVWFVPMPNLLWMEPTVLETRNSLIHHFGPWFSYLHTPYNYLVIVVSLVILAQSAARRQKLYRMQTALMIFAFSLPLLMNIYYTAILPRIPEYNYTTAVFSLTGLIILWDLHTFEFLNLLPAAREKVVEYMQDGVIVLDMNHRIIDMNPAAVQTFTAASSCIGRNMQELLPEACVQACEQLDQEKRRTQVEVSGSTFDLQLSYMRNARNEKRGIILTFRDITEQIQLHQQVRTLKNFDPLTGLLNRGKMIEQGERLYRESTVLSILMMDVDKFKIINDTYGQDTGDQVLVELGAYCKSLLKKTQLLGRLGGDEFVILLPEFTLSQAMPLADRIIHGLESRGISTGSRDISVGLSIGAASSSLLVHEQNIGGLFTLAARALNQAKQRGRNQAVSAEAEGFFG